MQVTQTILEVKRLDSEEFATLVRDSSEEDAIILDDAEEGEKR